MAPHPHLFQGYRWCFAIMVYIYVLSLSSIASKNITITIEEPFKEVTEGKILLKGIEQFESLERKLYPMYTYFTTNLWRGVYHNVTVAPADWFGGAGGKGFYAFTRTTQPYQLEITEITGRQERGVNYFGLWVSAMKKVDQLNFYYKKKPIFNTTLKMIYDKMPKEDNYWENPYFPTTTKTQFFVFINFYFGTEYDEVHFSSPVDWFCSDNHSIGRWEKIHGHIIYKGQLLLAESSSPRAESPRAEPTPPKAQRSRPRAQSITLAKADLIPTISTVWITVGVILGIVALV